MPYKNDFGFINEEPDATSTVCAAWEEQPITLPLFEYKTLVTRVERLIVERDQANSRWYEAQRELSTLREQMGGE